MKNRTALAPLLLILSLALPIVGQAEPNAQANQNLTDHSVDDMVAIATAGQHNEAIAEAQDIIVGDFADDFVDGQAQADNNPTLSNPSSNSTPKRSNVQDFDDSQFHDYVMDEAQILSASERQKLSQKLNSLYYQGLGQIAILTVPSTNGRAIDDYTIEKAHEFGIGDKQNDDGILFVVAVNDRKMWIATGYGREGVLPDVVVSRIIRNDITPYFKQNDYAGGLATGINRIEERLTTDPEILAQADAQAEKVTNEASQEEVSPIVL